MNPQDFVNETHYYILLLHVIAGVVCLITGLIAIFANPKGGKLHKKAGIVYFWSMVVIFLTSIISVTFFRFHFFFFMIAIFSFFLSFTGYRALKRKKPNDVKWYDRLMAYAGFVTGIVLIGYGIYKVFLNNNLGFLAICLVFGFLLSANAYKDITHFKKSEYEKMWWWFHHLNMMMASFIAAFTAFLVNNIYKIIDAGDWGFIFWLLPSIIIVPIMNKWTKYYKKKFNLEK